MEVAQAVFSSLVVVPGSWSADWAWGVPLIVLTVIIHVLGLGLIAQEAVGFSNRMFQRRHPTVVFVTVVGATTLFATCLHALEAGIWASAYWLLGALPDERLAMLYSLSAITSYGHETLQLKEHWQLMGSLEALNGWLLFGLTTAFLFGMIEKVWSLGNKAGRR
ncbi:MAG TPA: hypothetical protein VII23_15120 [Terriglobales bacterium]|jgi:MFS superfamily sulfate permease-like transporter